jgi:hypothetical protein
MSAANKPAFCGQANGAFVALLGDPATSAGARLRIASVVAEMVPRTVDDSLAPSVTAMLNDVTDAVAYLGVKVANNEVPLALQTNAAAQTTVDLLKAVVAAVGKHQTGPIAEYTAEWGIKDLIFFNHSNTLTLLKPAAKGQLVDADLALLKARVGMYQQGIPESPFSDSFFSLVLFDPATWAIMTPAQQLATVQETSDLLASIGQRVAQQPANQRQLIDAAKDIAEQMLNIQLFQQSPTLKSALTTISGISALTSGAQVATYCGSLFAALQTVPQFLNLTPPPTVPQGQ